jgi:hypothetical protein
MKPLSRFFRPVPAPPPPLEERINALDSESSDAITATALGDGPEALRAAAIAKLQDGDPLRKLARLSDGAAPGIPASLERIAQQRMAQLIDAGTSAFAALRASASNTTAMLSVAELCRNPGYLSEVLASIDDPQAVARLVLEGPSSRIRQLAAQIITDPAQLQRLVKLLRGKDKNTYKIIKQKCDVLRAEEQRIAQVENDVLALCASLERLSIRTYEALYGTSLHLLEDEWQLLEPQAPPRLRDRALLAIDRCREVIAGHERQLAEHAAEASQRAALQAAREQAFALAAEAARYREAAAAVAALEAVKIREAEEMAHAEKLAAEALALRQLGGLVAKAEGALRDGKTGQAAGLRRAIEEKLPTQPVLPASLARQLHQLDTKLIELKEWKEHAVAPKRAELIEEMEALIGSSEEPQTLAERIKYLQSEWKTISKGINSDSEADWQRFHQASETAYQRCREYFAAQAKLRQENLQKRMQVLERLRAFESAHGEHPDWRTVAAVLREAPQEWRRHFPVDRAAGVAAQEEFDATLGRLQGRIDTWYAQNVAEKSSLIQRARQLCAQEDGREATDAVKRLQALWQDVGAVPRDQERRLWEEFRAQCDAVFHKRQQAHTEYLAGLEASKAKAVALIEEAEQAAGLSGPALLEGAAKNAQRREAFEALSELPRAEERALHARFERALDLCRSRVAQQRAHDREQSFTDLLEAARRIQTYGWAVAQNSAPAESEALKQAAEIFIADIQHWPKGGQQAIDEAWAKAHTAAGLDAAANETALRMLCIRCEIFTETATPAEDQALRRDYQMQRLVQRMGQHNTTNPDELNTLAFDWIRVGPVLPSTHAALLARFLRCRS